MGHQCKSCSPARKDGLSAFVPELAHTPTGCDGWGEMHAVWWILIIILMIGGLVGCIFPLLPDTPLIVGAAVLHHVAFGPQGASWTTLLVLTALMLITLALDLLSGSVGAKYFGATRWGAIGGFLGAIIGLFYGPIGIFVGPIAGVLIGNCSAARACFPPAARPGAPFLAPSPAWPASS